MEAIEERRKKHLEVTNRVFKDKSTKDTGRNDYRVTHMKEEEAKNAKRAKEDRQLN